MKKSLLLVAAALCTMSAFALPAEVAAVSPAEGIVDISNNANPKGVSEISVTFNGRAITNPNATGDICIYYNNSQEPAEMLPVSKAYVDAMGYPMGAFNFTHTYKEAGIYHITVPEGTWLIEGTDGNTPSPALDLNYEILPSFVSSPEEGVVGSIETLTYTMRQAFDVTVKDASKIKVYTQTEDLTFTTFADGNYFEINLTDPAKGSVPGTYYVEIGAGAVAYTLDGVERTNFATLYTYTITSMTKPAIDPANTEIPSFGNFTIYPPVGYTVNFVDTYANCFVYKLDDNGNTLSDPVVKYGVKQDGENILLYPVTSDGQEITEPVKVENGTYILKLGQIAFFTKDDQFVPMPPFSYYYQVKNPVAAEDAFVSGHVYNEDGTPAAGAFVQLTNNKDYYYGVSADENGYYMIDQFPTEDQMTENYNVTAYDSSWVNTFEKRGVKLNAKGNVYDIRFGNAQEQKYTLVVNVNNESGVSLYGATVTVNNDENLSAISDDLGIARITLLNEEATKNVEITVTANGYAPYTQKVEWGAEPECEITVTLGTLTGIDGINAENGEVKFFNLQGQRVLNPVQGQVVIRVANGKAVKEIRK